MSFYVATHIFNCVIYVRALQNISKLFHIVQLCVCDVDEYIFLFLLSYNFVLLTFYRDLGENRAHALSSFPPKHPVQPPEVPYFLAYRTSTYVPPSILSYNVTLTYSIYIYHVCGLTVLWLKGIFLFLFLTVVWLDFRGTIQIRCHCKSTIPLSSSCCTNAMLPLKGDLLEAFLYHYFFI